MPIGTSAWMVSLHGGHSSEFCDHAHSPLREMLEAAVQAGYHTFGVTEHAPRVEARFLYPNEIALGWDVPKIIADFERYAQTLPALVEEFASRLVVLRGFEIEVVPAASYVQLMQEYRQRYQFEYIVGSVHYVDEISIDGSVEDFQRAMETAGGLESLAVRYYRTVAQMVEALRPEVVAHLDLIKLHGHRFGSCDTPMIRRAVEEALEAIRERDGIIEVNTAGYRKGLGEPYPASWLVQMAHRMGIGFCFGDDSHRVEQVGFGIEAAREHLLRSGVHSVTVLTREGAELVRQVVPLETSKFARGSETNA
ncbi:MAG: putative histidinol-phosphatase [Armatimonadota bacterium]|nr:MAG: putative histidinol-phosphatase [Armatimonadota bacterium]